MGLAHQEDLFSDYAKRVSAPPAASAAPVNRMRRVRCVVLFSGLWIALVIGRLYQLQIAQHSDWSGSATKQHHSTVQFASERGPILDRNGKLLATSVPGGSVYVRPYQVKDREKTVRYLSEILELQEEEIEQKLDKKSPFVWVARQVPRHLAKRVEAAKLSGVGYHLEPRRYYPHGRAASVLLGKVGVDGNGLSGIEALYEGYLNDAPETSPVVRDGVGNIMHVTHREQRIPRGQPLALTLDATIQLIVDEELDKGREEAKAERAYGVMVNARTGEILAMSQSPSPNFNLDKVSSKELLKNHIVESAFEPGSIMKPLVAAVALQEGVTHFHELIDCEKGAYRFGGHTINDVHPSSILSTYNVVVHSSNVGMTKLGERLGKQKLHEGLKSFGFGDSTQIGFVGEAQGLLRSFKRWYPIDIATHSFGQGVAVTPLQMVRAVSAIANGGILPSLQIVADEPFLTGERILEPEIAEQVQRMMVGVVEDEEGTGSRARIPGVVIGGKTGTAQRPREGARGYEPGAYISSFIGFADGHELGVDDPLTFLVVMDRPSGGSIYGGTVSAPVFQRAMQRTLHFLSTQQEGYSLRGEIDGDFRLPQRAEGNFHLAKYTLS